MASMTTMRVALPQKPVSFRKQMSGKAVAVAPARVAIRAKQSSLVVKAGSYTIQNGDWVSTIAPKFGCTIADLRDANPGVDIDNIYPGMQLNVPNQKGNFGTKTWIGIGVILALVLTALLNKPDEE